MNSIDDTVAGISYYETTGISAFVPVYDSFGGTGSNAWYHIVGYTAVQIVHINGGTTIRASCAAAEACSTSRMTPH